MGPYEDWVYVIFKCKDNCKTIFTDSNIKEMRQYTETMT